MNKEKFFYYLEVYGANPKRWPDDIRALAADFFNSDDVEIVSAISAERALDGMLDSDLELDPISVSLEASLIDLVPSSNRPKKEKFWHRLAKLKASKWSTSGLIGAALMGGVGVGYAQAVEQAELNAVHTMLTFASAEEFSDLSDNEWFDTGEAE